MRLAVLGPVELVGADGITVTPKGERARTLLAVLAARSGTAVSTDAVAEALWGDDLPRDPAAAVQTAMSRLRRVLDDDAVETGPAGYVLRVDEQTLDSARFEQLLAAARVAREQDADGALRLLDDALACWRGPAYADIDADVVRHEAGRLDELRLRATEDRAELLIERGRADEAIAALDALILDQPYRERARAGLMRARYLAGQQTEALATYREYRDLLTEELGLEPSPTLQALEGEILRHELDAPTGERPVRAAGRRRLDPRIVYVPRPGGGHVAAARAGRGDPLVVVPPWVGNIEAISGRRDWRSDLFERLAEHAELILWDRYGTGMSNGPLESCTFDDSVAEAVAVLDHLGIERAPVLAISAAGPIAVGLEHRRPSTTSAAIFVGSFASGPATFPDRSLCESMVGMVRAHWGIGSKVLADMFVPDAPPDEAEWFVQLQREAATPDVAALLLQQMYDVDVTELLPTFGAPTLVVHARRDRAIPFRGAEQLVAGIPDAQLVAVDSRNHLPLGEEADRIADLAVEFVAERAAT